MWHCSVCNVLTFQSGFFFHWRKVLAWCAALAFRSSTEAAPPGTQRRRLGSITVFTQMTQRQNFDSMSGMDWTMF